MRPARRFGVGKGRIAFREPGGNGVRLQSAVERVDPNALFWRRCIPKRRGQVSPPSLPVLPVSCGSPVPIRAQSGAISP